MKKEDVLYVATTREFPPYKRFEISFFGRSNVGKSSLINALYGSSIARASKTPGKTQAALFFPYKSCFMVDFPGYGYAKVPLKVRQHWEDLFLGYVNRVSLGISLVLIDGRRGLCDQDHSVIKFLEDAGRFFLCVYTKMDTRDAQKNINENDKHPYTTFFTSTRTNKGIGPLRAHLLNASRQLS